jgi:hypothetical protein
VVRSAIDPVEIGLVPERARFAAHHRSGNECGNPDPDGKLW